VVRFLDCLSEAVLVSVDNSGWSPGHATGSGDETLGGWLRTRLITGRLQRDLQRSTHVEALLEAIADAGSTPAASTSKGPWSKADQGPFLLFLA